MAEEGVHDTQSFRISTLSRRLPRPLGFLLRIGDHSRIQTCNLALRTGLLCSIELRGRGAVGVGRTRIFRSITISGLEDRLAYDSKLDMWGRIELPSSALQAGT